MILVKTETGHQVFKDRSVRLSPRQRSAYILFDGKRSLDEVLAAGMGITSQEIEEMVGLGLLDRTGAAAARPAAPAAATMAPLTAVAAASVPAPAPAPSAVAPAVEIPVPAAAVALAAPTAGRTAQQRYKDAYPIATQLTGSLGLRGFRLNLAVEGTTRYEELVALAPKIRAAVGPEKADVLDRALNG